MNTSQKTQPASRVSQSPAPSYASESTDSEDSREGVGPKLKIPITVTKPFNFTLDHRLKDRQHYNEDLKKRQRAAEERERISKLQRKREEAEDLKKYRKTLEFKANPILNYQGISLSPSEKELTVPQGPRLMSINRARHESREGVSRADSRGSSESGDHPYSTYSYNGPTLL